MRQNVSAKADKKIRKKVKPKRKSAEMNGENTTDTKTEKKFVYEIVNMSERPYLNGKHATIVNVLSENQYRISLVNNGSQHVLNKSNLLQITEKHKREKPIDV